MNKIELNIQPQASVYSVFTRLSYEEWYALAEFIDNSTASFYSNESTLNGKLTVEINYDKTLDMITIEDDAYGMEIDQFKRAILLESTPQVQGGRNEFGMGLKTAATWFGKKWSVESTELGSKNLYKSCVDLNKIVNDKSNLIDILVEETERDKHFTKITIEKLNRQLSSTRIKKKIVEILESMYRRDLESGLIEILFNGLRLEFKQYKPLNYDSKVWKKNLTFSFNFNNREYSIKGFVAILDKGGFDKAGFSLFRRDRVVVGGLGKNYKPKEIFSQTQSQISLKLYGELDMDSFDINQAKDGFSWDSELEEEFIKNLKLQIVDYIKIAKMSRKELNDTQISLTSNILEPVRDNQSGKVDQFVRNENNNSEMFMNEKTPISNECKSDTNSNLTFSSQIDRKLEFQYILNNVKYTTILSPSSKLFFYQLNLTDNILNINFDHPFFKSIHENELSSVCKLILSISLSEQKAQRGSIYEGYHLSSMFRNQVDKILSEITLL